MKKIPVGKSHFALVDDDDYDDLSQFKWSFKTSKKDLSGYAERVWRVDKQIFRESMHTRLTGFNQTDHVNRNGLDNRRENLRSATNSQNGANRPKQRGNYTSEYKGVTWHEGSGKWRGQIKFNMKVIHLGTFNNEIDAAKAYDAAARQYFGEFAHCNFEEND